MRRTILAVCLIGTLAGCGDQEDFAAVPGVPDSGEVYPDENVPVGEPTNNGNPSNSMPVQTTRSTDCTWDYCLPEMQPSYNTVIQYSRNEYFR